MFRYKSKARKPIAAIVGLPPHQKGRAMSHIIHRNLHRPPPLAVQASGITVTDSTGRTYLDASGGAAVSSLGHAHPEVLAAMHAQIERNAYAHTAFFTCEAAELAARLAADAPGDLDHVYLVSGGSEAMESALKLARQYWLEAGQPQRSVFIARRQSYHGNTWARWPSAATNGGARRSRRC
jgi:adenosylmethionine-8-amino-7-oxononanoate aminotransferase